jgi:hypothetical protein
MVVSCDTSDRHLDPGHEPSATDAIYSACYTRGLTSRTREAGALASACAQMTADVLPCLPSRCTLNAYLAAKDVRPVMLCQNCVVLLGHSRESQLKCGAMCSSGDMAQAPTCACTAEIGHEQPANQAACMCAYLCVHVFLLASAHIAECWLCSDAYGESV